MFICFFLSARGQGYAETRKIDEFQKKNKCFLRTKNAVAEDDDSGSESRDLPAGHRLLCGVTSGVIETISSVMNEL